VAGKTFDFIANADTDGGIRTRSVDENFASGSSSLAGLTPVRAIARLPVYAAAAGEPTAEPTNADATSASSTNSYAA
jgi:hypothetical protein